MAYKTWSLPPQPVKPGELIAVRRITDLHTVILELGGEIVKRDTESSIFGCSNGPGAGLCLIIVILIETVIVKVTVIVRVTGMVKGGAIVWCLNGNTVIHLNAELTTTSCWTEKQQQIKNSCKTQKSVLLYWWGKGIYLY